MILFLVVYKQNYTCISVRSVVRKVGKYQMDSEKNRQYNEQKNKRQTNMIDKIKLKIKIKPY